MADEATKSEAEKARERLEALSSASEQETSDEESGQTEGAEQAPESGESQSVEGEGSEGEQNEDSSAESESSEGESSEENEGESGEGEEGEGEESEGSEADESGKGDAPRNGARARIKLREQAEKIRQLEKQVESAKTGKGMEDPVGSFRKAQSAGDESEEMRARQEIGRMSSDDLLEALNGESDPDVSRTLRDALVESTAREKRDEAHRKQREDEVERLYRAEANDAKSTYPEFFKADTDEAKFMRDFDAQYIGKISPDGTFEEEGDLSQEAAIHLLNHPLDHAQVASMAYRAKQTDTLDGQVKKLKAENAKLRKQAGLKDQPEKGGGPQGQQAPKKKDSASLRKKLEQLSS